MPIYWYLIIGIYLALLYLRHDLRKLMLFFGIFALPCIVIWPMISMDFSNIVDSNGIFIFILARVMITFAVSGILLVIYETYFHKFFNLLNKPYRQKLIWLFFSIIVFFVLHYLFNFNLALSLIGSLALNLLMVLLINAMLVWDLIFSAVGMGVAYLVIFIITFANLPGDVISFWLTQNLSGINLFSLPIEELLIIIAFGALWGPVYVAFKDIREK